MTASSATHLIEEAETLPSLLLNSAAAANAVMLGGGYFNPLTGYMNLADALSVAEKMHTVDGLFFPVPILNRTSEDGHQGRQPHRPARPQCRRATRCWRLWMSRPLRL